MKLVFMGTPEFAVPALERLVEAGHEVAAVYTQPDRPKGRGRKLAMPPVKEAALRLGLRVEQPRRIRRPEAIEQLREIEPEAIAVVGYGQLLPQAVLDLPARGCINVHASLLPKYRGAAPVQWAVARGETRTGVTTMRIAPELDTGDVLLQWETEIGPEETAVELGRRLGEAGATLLVQTLDELESIQPEPQDDAQASFAPIMTKEDGHIDWSLTAAEIVNRVRGLVPWPGCYGILRGQQLHIWKARVSEPAAIGGPLDPGRMRIAGKKLLIGAGDGAIEALEVQMQGRRRMPAAAFLNGFTMAREGEVLE